MFVCGPNTRCDLFFFWYQLFSSSFCRLEIAMAGVMQKFVTASLFMWITPVAILYAFNNNLLPGKAVVPIL